MTTTASTRANRQEHDREGLHTQGDLHHGELENDHKEEEEEDESQRTDVSFGKDLTQRAKRDSIILDIVVRRALREELASPRRDI